MTHSWHRASDFVVAHKAPSRCDRVASCRRRPFCRDGAARGFGARVARVLPAAARVRGL